MRDNISGSDMQKEWNARAAIDPLHATVNSHAPGEWDVDEYMRTGEDTARIIFAKVHEVYQDIRREEITCLEIGGGAGRLTYYLSKIFPRVLYLDVSTTMKKAASHLLKERGVKNVTFLIGNGEDLSVVTEPVQFVFSVIVFQHMPPEHQYNNLREAARVLDAGGVMAIHMYADVEEYMLLSKEWELRRQQNDLLGWSNLAWAELPRYETGMRHAVDPDQVKILLEEAGMEVTILPGVGNDHDFLVVARKN